MKFNPDGTCELTSEEAMNLMERHLMPDYNKVVDKLKELLPQANLGLAVMALVLAKHVNDKCELIEPLVRYATEYAVYAEYMTTVTLTAPTPEQSTENN